MYNIIYNICLAILETKPSFIFGLRGMILICGLPSSMICFRSHPHTRFFLYINFLKNVCHFYPPHPDSISLPSEHLKPLHQYSTKGRSRVSSRPRTQYNMGVTG